MHRLRLYELLRYLKPEQFVNVHLISSLGPMEMLKSVSDMLSESSAKRQHEILWKVSIYSREIALIKPNIDCLEVWLR